MLEGGRRSAAEVLVRIIIPLGKTCSKEQVSNRVSVSSAKPGCQMGAEVLALPRLQQSIAREPVGTVNCKYIGHVTLFRAGALELVVA